MWSTQVSLTGVQSRVEEDREWLRRDKSKASNEYLCTSEPFSHSRPLFTGQMHVSVLFLTSVPLEEKL